MNTQTPGDELLDGLRELYSAEKQQTKILPEMAKAASNPELASNLAQHAGETVTHVKRLEQACRAIGVARGGGKSDSMTEMLSEGTKLRSEATSATEVDASLVTTAKEIEDYETEEYEKVLETAKELGVEEAVEGLNETLEEEKASQAKLSKLKES